MDADQVVRAVPNAVVDELDLQVRVEGPEGGDDLDALIAEIDTDPTCIFFG
jgi:hypothetical protein